MTNQISFALTGSIVITINLITGEVTWRELGDDGSYVNGGLAVIDGDVTVLTNAGSHRHLYGDEDYAEDDADFGSIKELERWTRTRYWRWSDDVLGEEPVTRFAGSGEPVDA